MNTEKKLFSQKKINGSFLSAAKLIASCDNTFFRRAVAEGAHIDALHSCSFAARVNPTTIGTFPPQIADEPAMPTL
ncbi:MAG: hypothetical protein R3B54_18555 [Bdellovibrionota bacterium]